MYYLVGNQVVKGSISVANLFANHQMICQSNFT
jgi:hypothetical protein